MKIEKVKSFFLVLLFMSSVYFTGVYMINKTSETGDLELNRATIPSVDFKSEGILRPQGLYINFGGDSHTAFFIDNDALWIEISDSIINAIQNSEFVISDKVMWKTVSSEKSIRIKFNEYSSINRNFRGELENDIYFEEIVLSLLDRKILLIRNENNIYKLPISSISHITSIINSISNEGYIEFKTIEKRFSIKSILESTETETKENLTVIPISNITDIPFYKAENTINLLDKDEVKIIANKIFGPDLSFVKKMNDYDGSIIFMSDYGKKILTLRDGGIVEYINNIKVKDNVINKGFDKNLDLAVSFIKYFRGNIDDIWLTNYVENDNIIKLYFNYKIDGNNIYNKGNFNGSSDEMHIKGDEVVYYRSSSKTDFDAIYFSDFWENALSFSNIFDKNFNIISENYMIDNDKDEILDSKLHILMIVNAIELFEFEYFIDTTIKTNNYIPAWKIKIDNTIYHFDLYEGILLHFEKEDIYGLEEN